MGKIEDAQEFMNKKGIDAWLIYDYKGINPALVRVVGKIEDMTRPCFYFIPAEGEPTFLAHFVDAGRVSEAGINTKVFHGRDEMVSMLEGLLRRARTVAMEYSPMGELPRVGKVDAGTVELVRSLDCEVVSSGDLAQYVTLRWGPRQLESHKKAAKIVSQVVLEAFDYIGERLASKVTEYDVKQYTRKRFAEEGLFHDSGPTVAINEHCSDPHYQPTEGDSSVIKEGDWVLIDLWAREPHRYGIYCDICWVAYVGSKVPDEYQSIFDMVVKARDRAFNGLNKAIKDGVELQGRQVDRMARDYIEQQGYGEYFGHRLGHSLGEQFHWDGANLDDLETHDTRLIIPWVGLTIEPGIYLKHFGVRSEINLMVQEDGLLLTTPAQKEVVLIKAK